MSPIRVPRWGCFNKPEPWVQDHCTSESTFVTESESNHFDRSYYHVPDLAYSSRVILAGWHDCNAGASVIRSGCYQAFQ